MEQFSISFEKEEESKEKAAQEGSATQATVHERSVSGQASKTAAEESAALREHHALTVSELTAHIKQLVDRNFFDVWVVGEVSNFRGGKGRPHFYFSLKDENSQLSAVMFNGAARIGFELVDGLELVCHGNVTVYGPRGQYQIVVDECYPKGVGALQLAFEQLKKKLDDEGLFRAEHKSSIPFLPRRIGVVTSPTGAAVRDIIHVLTRRYPPIEILLYPVKVQGDGAAEEIAHAIDAFNRRGDVDVMIVGRGGGSLEDLWAFNEEVVARAIFNSRIALISAVGHEIDFTIADFVADVRAPTPSAAAEIAVPVLDDLKRAITDRRHQLTVALHNRVKHDVNELDRLKGRIPDPRRMIPDLVLRVDGFRERLIYSAQVTMEKRESAVASFLDNLKHLSPFHILEKGYAVVQKKNGRVVKDTAVLAMNEGVDVVFHKGRAEAVITKLNN